MNRFRIWLAIGMALTANARATNLVGAWEFAGNLNSATGGSSMVAAGWSPSYRLQSINGVDTLVLEVPALSSSQTLAFLNPIGSTGGGLRTNDFSIGWDLSLRSPQRFESLLQTTPSNTDDVDVYVGDGVLSPGGGRVTSDMWHRFVMTSTSSGGSTEIRFYLDGSLLSGTPSVVDGRFSLMASALIFSDDNGETGDAYLSSFALWDGALTASEIATLAGATAGGFAAVPEPMDFGPGLAIGLGALVWMRRRDRSTTSVGKPLRRLRRITAVRSGVLAAGLLLAGANALRSATLITNLNNGPTPSGSYVGSDVLRSEGFTLADGLSFELESVTIILTSGGTGFTLQIYGDNGGQPFLPLVDLTTSETIDFAIVPHTFAPVTPLTLTGNTTYWLVVKGTTPFDSSTSVWWEMPGPAHTTAPGVSFAGSRYTFNSGAVWNSFTAVNGLSFEVTAVPEPASAFLLAGGSLAVLVLRRRRRAVRD